MSFAYGDQVWQVYPRREMVKGYVVIIRSGEAIQREQFHSYNSC